MEQIASRFVLLAALAAGVLVAPRPARRSSSPGPASAVRPRTPGRPRRPPPPALPGARVSKEMVAPPDRPPSDLQPNDALFDAINRGDIATARDAISRGADLNARNVLGMTPMELSVDLGRNDISFLLLSMRGSGRRQRAAPRGESGGSAAAHAREESESGAQAAARPGARSRPGRPADRPAVRRRWRNPGPRFRLPWVRRPRSRAALSSHALNPASSLA